MDMEKLRQTCDSMAADHGVELAVIRHFRDGALMIMPRRQVHVSRIVYVSSEQNEKSPVCNTDDSMKNIPLFSV